MLTLSRPIVILDIEATGPDLVTDRIIDIAMIRLNTDGSRDTLSYRFDPEHTINPEAEKIHGISQEDVRGKPKLRDKADDLYAFLDGCDIGGFNSNYFDIPLLIEEFHRVGKHFSIEDRRLIDAFQLYVMHEKRDLSSAFQFYCGKQLENAHTAQADAEAAADVLAAQFERYDLDASALDEVHEMCRPQDFVDSGRRIVRIDGEMHFNFGKHKGLSLDEVYQKEPQFFDWILNRRFTQDTKRVVASYLKGKRTTKKADKPG